MRKSLLVFTIIIAILFMVSCENSINPTSSMPQSGNTAKIGAQPFGGENNNVIAKKGPKPPKPPKPNKWYVPGDFATIQEAIDNAGVADGDKIFVGPGTFAGAIVTKAVEIRGVDYTVINDGTVLTSKDCNGETINLKIGFFFTNEFTGSGANINHFTFENLEFPVFSRGADNVIVEHCYLFNPIQGITNWAGNGWTISHNEIIDLRTLNGGGIGIFIGDNSLRVGGINGSNVMHNKIHGILTSPCEEEGGGYEGTGLVLYSDARWPTSGYLGAESIFNNIIDHNKVSLVSDTPELVDVVGCELTEATIDEPTGEIIYNNIIKFNDFRGTANPFVFTPESLEWENEISKNHVD